MTQARVSEEQQEGREQEKKASIKKGVQVATEVLKSRLVSRREGKKEVSRKKERSYHSQSVREFLLAATFRQATLIELLLQVHDPQGGQAFAIDEQLAVVGHVLRTANFLSFAKEKRKGAAAAGNKKDARFFFIVLFGTAAAIYRL